MTTLRIVRNTGWNLNLRGAYLIVDAATGICVNGYESRTHARRVLNMFRKVLAEARR